MNWTEFLADTNKELAALRKAMPDAAKGFTQLAQAATAPARSTRRPRS